MSFSLSLKEILIRSARLHGHFKDWIENIICFELKGHLTDSTVLNTGETGDINGVIFEESVLSFNQFKKQRQRFNFSQYISEIEISFFR